MTDVSIQAGSSAQPSAPTFACDPGRNLHMFADWHRPCQCGALVGVPPFDPGDGPPRDLHQAQAEIRRLGSKLQEAYIEIERLRALWASTGPAIGQPAPAATS